MTRVGGNAYNKGIYFRTDNYTMRMEMQKSGGYTLQLKENSTSTKKAFGKVVQKLEKIPLLRGVISFLGINKLILIMVLALLLYDLGVMVEKRGGITVGEEVFAILFPAVFLVIFLCLLFYIIKNIGFRAGSTWQFHGAEHKVINTYDSGQAVNLENAKSASRVARRCGTELVVFLLIIFPVCDYLIPYDSLSIAVAWGLSYELFKLKNGDHLPVISWLFKAGYFFQKHIFTREPKEDQLAAAAEALSALLKVEHGLEPAEKYIGRV